MSIKSESESFQGTDLSKAVDSLTEYKPLITKTYFQLVENEVENVSSVYKKMHLVFLGSASMSSFILLKSFEYLITSMGNNCIMYSNLSFQLVNESYSSVGNFKMEKSFHNTVTIWGRTITCNFCSTVSLLSFLVALIMFTFIIFIPKGGYTSGNVAFGISSEILAPFTIIATTVFVLVTALFGVLRDGLRDFCIQFKQELHNSWCGGRINDYSLIFNKKKIDINHYVTMVYMMGCWMFISWGGLLFTFIFRMLRAPDFKIIAYHLENVRPSDMESISSSESGSDVEVEIQKRSTITPIRRNAFVRRTLGRASTQSDLITY